MVVKTETTPEAKSVSVKKELFTLFMTLVSAFISAFTLHVFVYPADFAPSGVDGIAAMLQKLTGFGAGYYTLFFNLPLLAVAWFFLKRRYVVYTVIFTIVSSVLIQVFAAVDFYKFVSASDKLLPAIFSGILLGVRTGFMLRFGASTGGIDIIAGIVQKKKPYANVERTISIIAYLIIGVSYFVYRDVECILLSIVQMFVFEKAAAVVMRDTRNAVKFEIITNNPDALRNEIIFNLKHGATVTECKGMFTDETRFLVITIVNNRQVPEFMNIIKRLPDTFVYFSEVTGVRGNFRWFKDDAVK